MTTIYNETPILEKAIDIKRFYKGKLQSCSRFEALTNFFCCDIIKVKDEKKAVASIVDEIDHYNKGFLGNNRAYTKLYFSLHGSDDDCFFINKVVEVEC